MRNLNFKAAGVLALAGVLSGCGDYLTSEPDLTANPNEPSQATAVQLYNSMQVRQFLWHNGDLARSASMFVQQMAGTDRQYIDRDQYVVTEDDFSGYFSGIYTGGGLVDLRQIREKAEGDRLYAGITKVYEGYLIGMAASLWGDIPYSDAVGENPKPKLDDQAQVYAAVQKVLDEAIADLQAGGTGPRAVDLVYGGNAQKWAQAANTLKARFYMHWVEAQAAGGASAGLASTACGGNCVDKAIAAAQNGISTPANNFNSFHTTKRYEENPWFQFMTIDRPAYISAGKNLVDLMQSRNDPRLTQYFSPVGGTIRGAAPASSPASQLSAVRGAPGFDQPLITYAENQLILAEAHYRKGNTAAALTHLNNARTSAGLAAVTGVSGAALLQEIAIEKYIALFQNVEAWNDYKRLCTPSIKPVTGTEVIGRLLYGSAERNANSDNIPRPAQQPKRNDNDPNACA